MPASSQPDFYFRPPQLAFWSWQDEGRVLVWDDETTIAFRQELSSVLARLAPQGLPPLGSLIMLLAACRDSWDAAPPRADVLRRLLANLSGAPPGELFHTVMDGLHAVHQLPRELRGSTAAKAEIAALVFEDCRARLPAKDSAALCRALELGLGIEPFDDLMPPDGLTALLGDLAALRAGLPRVEAQVLALRLKTGLDQSVQAAPIDLDPVGRVRSLIAELEDDEELGGLARLTRLLMAAVQLPRALSDPEDLPLGGVSDISNRGALDRLLLSELAHDDLTLAVRVAVNEALYLRRESPPRTPPRQRNVLLDSGIRLWGVPRVFATAIGLALAATADSRLSVAAFRAAGSETEPVELTTREGLIEHLAVLDHRAHPGEALMAMAARLEAEAEPVDLVLITSEEVLADRAFQQVLSQVPLDSFHIATVARDGRFRLIHRSPRGGKLLREAKLSLDEVLAPRPKRGLELINRKAVPLPAIFGVHPFPLWLSCPRDVESSWYVHDEGVLTYRHGRLLCWTKPNLGARELATDLPLGKLHWCSPAAPNGVAMAVIGSLRPNGLHVLRVNLDTDEVRTVPLRLDAMHPEEAFCRDGVAMVIGHKERRPWINIASLDTGDVLVSKSLPPMGPRRGAYFQHQTSSETQWNALSFDGLDLKIHTIAAQRHPDGPVQTLFTAQGVEGPIGVMATGDIIDMSTTIKRQRVKHGLTEPLRVRRISRDGHRLLLCERYQTATATNRMVLVESLTGKCHDVYYDYPELLEPQLAEFAQPLVLRHKFDAIVVDARGHLALIGRHDHSWPLLLDLQPPRIVFPRAPETLTNAHRKLRFQTVEPATPRSVALRVAQWSDGSRAWLDARGLLHLQSSSPNVPQCTIVLTDRTTSGWVANGRTWGDPYFLGHPPTASASDVYQTVLRPFLDRLP